MRKYLSVLFALVLVVSFSLVTAVPAAAEVSPVVPTIEFVTGPTGGIVEWTTDEANSGSYSVELSTEGVPYTSESDYGEGRVIMSAEHLGLTLADVTSFSFYWKSNAASGLPFPYFALDTGLDGDLDGVADRWLIWNIGPADDTSEATSWTQWSLSTAADNWHVAGPGGPYSDTGVWDDMVTDVGGNAEILSARIAVGNGSTNLAEPVFVDDIEINGTTYDLEPRVINTTQTTGHNTIQTAIDDSTNGDTITVAAGTYDEQVIIDKSLTLQGGGSDITVIKSPASLTKTTWTHEDRDFYPIIEVNGASAHAITVHVRGFTIDGDYNFDVGELGEKKAFTGIVYRNADGSIQNNEVKKFRDEPLSTFQYGEGIWVIPGSTVTVANNDIHDYNKTGVRVSGVGAEATVTENTVTGYGPTDVIAQNGVLIYDGATGTVSNNTVTGHSYTPEPMSSGVMIYSAGSGVNVQDNPTLDSNDIGIAVYYSDDATVRGNTISSNAVGVYITDDDASTADTIQVNYNNITTNSVYGVYNEGGLGTVDAENNWWGNASGPSGAGSGSGDGVSDNVDYTPWLGEEYAPTKSTGTATGTGTVSFSPNSGALEDLTSVPESSLPALGKPNLLFPHGFFSFNIVGLTPGQTVIVTITFPSPVPIGTEYWKCHEPEGWIQIPMGSDDGDNMITITLVDGGLGDDDGTPNGVIVDQAGPGRPRSPGVGGEFYPVNKAAVLMPWLGLALILILAIGGGILVMRRQRAN